MNAFQSLGTMITSMPALIACGQLAFVQPATWPMPFQSETTRPSKPILPLRISVERLVAAVQLALGDPELLVRPRVERDHHGLRAGRERAVVALAVDVDHLGLGGGVDALVLAAGGAAVADEVLGGADHAVGADAVAAVALQAAHRLIAVGARDPRVLGEALVGAAPAVVADDGERRREGPVLAGRAHLLGGRGLDVADQARVVRRAEPDVVREQRRAEDVRVAVDRVDPPDRRDAGGVALLGGGPVGVGERAASPPGRRACSPAATSRRR